MPRQGHKNYIVQILELQQFFQVSEFFKFNGNHAA